MATHADIFERITKNPKKQETQAKEDNLMDDKAIETIKLLAKQVIEIREEMTKQEEVISKLKDEVISLRSRQSEVEGNINLSTIDQRDVAKQLRNLKARLDGNKIVENAENTTARFYKNHEQSKVMERMPEPEVPLHSDISEMSEQELIASMQRNIQSIANNNVPQKDAEAIAKDFIFARMPKLLNLD